ncbi:beta-galactosidase [Paraferrimonas haliotis]|uniref:Hydrolase n=1 Tax=Paraferrimonas haliotis TaxID=2013866 RepID=A0AA37WZF1_9GAMM|nr:beta-galactosidase [Paraferrimonas haliotis]GLS83856.1 hydrolase [Paraferrimonas haliotis]GLS83983.1 hydrolase [Paraferrimonas haliotis]
MDNKLLKALMPMLFLLSACNTDSTTVTKNEQFENSLPIVLFDRSLAEQSYLVETINASSAYTEQGLTINFDSKQNSYSAVNFKPQKDWNWKDYSSFNLAFEIINPNVESVQLYLDMQDANGDVYTRSVNVAENSKHIYYAKMSGHDLAPLSDDHSTELNFVSGLRSNPDTWESDDIQFISMWGKKNLDISAISRITLSVQSNLTDKSIVIEKIWLRSNPEMNKDFLVGISDKYGQNANVEFAEKIHNDSELLAARDKELASLQDHYNDDRSRFGGWKSGPKQESSGYFRTAKVDGVWSLVDPDGYLYLATGLDIIRLSNSSTMTGYDFDQQQIPQKTATDATPEDSQGLNRVPNSAVASRTLVSKTRKDMFQWLPSYDEPLGKHYGYRRSAHSGPLNHGETYSFYSANLERKYGQDGADFMQTWRDVTLKRMMTWGFTSLGNWTDPSYYGNDKVPFFANGWIIGDFETVSSGNDFWGALPDVFDPKFAERADFTVARVAKEVNNSPWCVGVFIDNEKSFGRPESNESHYGIVINTLTRNASDSPTKAAFAELMKNKYTTIDKLNAAWDSNIASWQSFDSGVELPLSSEQQLQDYSQMLYSYGEKYFAVVNDAMQRHMPNHLYLGARFPDWGMPKEVVEASAKHVDVISFNSYKEGLPEKSWQFLKDIDMPAIIGEFHIGSSDSGMFHPGLIHASSQQDRANMYKAYMESVFDNPYFIGAHWFQYIDSPLTGRAYDGENYNVGFITVADQPYLPMVEAAKQVNQSMYQRRFKQQKK